MRLFSEDRDTGITKWFHFDAETEEATIETLQDVTSIVEGNKADLNESTSLDRFGDMRRVASIPLSIYYDLKKKGIVDDQAALRKWLNDPDNRVFRTFRGRL